MQLAGQCLTIPYFVSKRCGITAGPRPSNQQPQSSGKNLFTLSIGLSIGQNEDTGQEARLLCSGAKVPKTRIQLKAQQTSFVPTLTSA